MDERMRAAAKLPGPGEYVLPNNPTSPVAKWGDQAPKSDVEWQIYRAKQLPGPGMMKITVVCVWHPPRCRLTSTVTQANTRTYNRYGTLPPHGSAETTPSPSSSGSSTGRSKYRCVPLSSCLWDTLQAHHFPPWLACTRQGPADYDVSKLRSTRSLKQLKRDVLDRL